MMLIAFAMTMTAMAVAITPPVVPPPSITTYESAFDIKLSATYYNGTEKMQAVIIDVDHGEESSAFIAVYAKGEVEFIPVEEFHADAKDGYAAAQIVVDFYDNYALFMSFGKAKKNKFQTKGVGLLADEEFLDGPSPYFNVSLRYNNKLTDRMNESDMDLALAAYLSKKTKLSETDILEDLRAFVSEMHPE